MTTTMCLSDQAIDAISIALRVSALEALAHLNDRSCISDDYWADELWNIDRAQRELGLDNTRP